METDNGYVYIIKVLDYYKIGKTINPNKRFYEYSRLMEFPEIIYCTFVKNFSKVENKLHKLFREKCTRGEWFHLEDNDLKIIYNILEQNRTYNDEVLSLEEIIKIHKRRENFVNNINKDKLKNKQIKIKNKQETNKVTNKKFTNKKNTLTEEEKIKKYNEITSKMLIGNVYTYKDICEILKQPVKTGRPRMLQLNNWKRYFSWINQTTQKFVITEIYDNISEIEMRTPGGAREGAGRKKKNNEDIKDQNYIKERRENESEQ